MEVRNRSAGVLAGPLLPYRAVVGYTGGMDANKQTVCHSPRRRRRADRSTPVTALQLVIAFSAGLAVVWTYFGLESRFGFRMSLPGWSGGMVLGMWAGCILIHDSRFLHQIFRSTAFFGGWATGMGSTMYVLHYPRWHGSDMFRVVASAAALVAFALLGYAFERKVAQRVH